MKHKNIFLFTFVLTAYLFFSCSDSSNSPTPSSKNLLPGEHGAYWLYEKFFLDSNKLRIKDSIEYDSMAVTGLTEKAGRKANVYTTFIKTNPDGQYVKDNEMYFINDGSKLLTHSSFFQSIFKNIPLIGAMPAFFEEQWVTLVDSDDDFWKIINAEFPEMELPMDSSTTILIKGSIDITGEKKGEMPYSILYKQYTKTEFLITMNLDITFTISFIPINIKPVRKLHLYFVEGLGMVETHLEPTDITIPLIGWKLQFSGEETELRNYYIPQ